MNFWELLNNNGFGVVFLLVTFMLFILYSFGMYLDYKTINKK